MLPKKRPTTHRKSIKIESVSAFCWYVGYLMVHVERWFDGEWGRAGETCDMSIYRAGSQLNSWWEAQISGPRGSDLGLILTKNDLWFWSDSLVSDRSDHCGCTDHGNIAISCVTGRALPTCIGIFTEDRGEALHSGAASGLRDINFKMLFLLIYFLNIQSENSFELSLPWRC